MCGTHPSLRAARSVMAVLLLLAAGCGGGGGGSAIISFGPTDGGAAGDMPRVSTDQGPPPPDLIVDRYPAGPYGPNVGDVLPNFTFQGYWSPTATMGLASNEPYGDVTFDMLRKSGKRDA